MLRKRLVLALGLASTLVWCAHASLLTLETELLPADAALVDELGYAVSVRNDAVVVGAHLDDDKGLSSGSAYVFRLVSGTWVEEAKLTASDGAPQDDFGAAVAIDGDVIVVGSNQEDRPGLINAGAAYVFRRTSGSWIQETKLVASDAAQSDRFGAAVAISGDTIAVSAFGDDALRGAVYVFRYTAATWAEEAKLVASDGVAGDVLAAVAIDGDTVVAGAPFTKDLGLETGSTYVFRRTGITWAEEAKLIRLDPGPSDRFGGSVAVSGDTLLVGAYLDDHPGLSNAGSVYVFSRTGATWSQEAKLSAVDKSSNDQFGGAVGLSGDLAVIGAQLADPRGVSNAGAAYVFLRTETTWTQETKLVAGDAAPGDRLGWALQTSGFRVVAGAPHLGSATHTGSACVFDLVVEVTLDIKPGTFPNTVNPQSKGVIPVAVLTTGDFDAQSVDPGTVRFGPDGAAEAHSMGHLEDVDGDGDLDLLLHFRVADTGIEPGDTEATLTGTTFDGKPLQGTDTLVTTPY